MASCRYVAAMTGTERDDVTTAVLARYPDVLHAFDRLQVAASRAVDPALLELCRLRIAALLGAEREHGRRTEAATVAGLDDATIAELPAWPTSARFDRRARACLAFCEQFVIDVAGMSDELAFSVADELGPEGFRTFVTALLVVEQRQRLGLAWERLFDAGTGG